MIPPRFCDAPNLLHAADEPPHIPPPTRKLGRAWGLFVGAWIALVALGVHARLVHATTEGARGMAPATYPSDARIPRAPGESTLLMFVHPECPCTRASLHELERVLANPAIRVAPVLVVATMIEGRRWEDTPIAPLAKRIPGLEVVLDPQGREMRRFGAQTSGHVVLYDAQGTLQFAGGVTGARGHEGENVGADSLHRLLRANTSAVSDPPVFGCSLRKPARAEVSR